MPSLLVVPVTTPWWCVTTDADMCLFHCRVWRRSGRRWRHWWRTTQSCRRCFPAPCASHATPVTRPSGTPTRTRRKRTIGKYAAPPPRTYPISRHEEDSWCHLVAVSGMWRCSLWPFDPWGHLWDRIFTPELFCHQRWFVKCWSQETVKVSACEGCRSNFCFNCGISILNRWQLSLIMELWQSGRWWVLI